MRILQTMFDIMDYGGIVNDVEFMTRGLETLGHQTAFVILRPGAGSPRMTKAETHIPGTYSSRNANQVNTISGWYGANVINYGSDKQLSKWRRYAATFDFIIHQIPAPKPDPEGWWRKIYKIDTPQMAIAHDAHFREMYPHMIDIAPHLVAVSCTNPAGYKALEALPAKRCFIGAPHPLYNWDKQTPWKHRPKRFVSAHVWKAWKHMDIVVRAIPLITDDEIDNVVGGDGIEARYMRSKDKCKPKYKGIWKAAMRAGMNYVGLVSTGALMVNYKQSRLMVDMSYSAKFAALGNHFNRSTIEAYNCGCVPLCTHENMSDDTGIFRPGKHYVGIPANCEPKRLAEMIEALCNMKPSTANAIVHAGRELLQTHFHYTVAAEDVIKISKGKKNIGIYNNLEMGKVTKQVQEARDAIIKDARLHSVKR